MSPDDVDQRKSDTCCIEIDLTKVPISALRTKTRQIISNAINRESVIFVEADGNVRDYRRLVHRIGVDYFDDCDLTQLNNIEKILREWEKWPLKEANLWKFQNILGLIGRWDVVGLTNDLFYEDAGKYLNDQYIDNNIIVDHNFECCHTSNNTTYDAYILCADEDRVFSMELAQRLEFLNFKICLQDDDHQNVLKHCDRLIIIVSPAFLDSREYTVFQNYSQTLHYGEDKNKIIPYLHKSCQLPDSLRFYFVLSYIESSYANSQDTLKECLSRVTANNDANITKTATSTRRKFFTTKFSMPRISNWAKWMKKFKKHKKCRVRVKEHFDDQPKRKRTSIMFNVGKMMREKMVL